MRYLFVLIAAVFLSGISNAQIHVNVNFNVNSQPVWGPTGYDYVENYYLPDIDAYYSVPQHRYYYLENGIWIGRSSLPSRYHDYNINNSYKVVINEREPWRNNKVYRDRYDSYRGRHDQQIIRDSRDSRYFAIANHPEHKNWAQKHDNGNHRGENRDSDHHQKRGGEHHGEDRR